MVAVVGIELLYVKAIVPNLSAVKAPMVVFGAFGPLFRLKARVPFAPARAFPTARV
jgi:hypothetical protein